MNPEICIMDFNNNCYSIKYSPELAEKYYNNLCKVQCLTNMMNKIIEYALSDYCKKELDYNCKYFSKYAEMINECNKSFKELANYNGIENTCEIYTEIKQLVSRTEKALNNIESFLFHSISVNKENFHKDFKKFLKYTLNEISLSEDEQEYFENFYSNIFCY